MNTYSKIILIFFFSGLPFVSKTQGQALFNSLKIPAYTKATALGGILNAHPGKDVSLFVHNPALLNGVAGNLSLQHTFYLADISAEQVNYAHHFEKAGLIGFSLQYINYGKFRGYDETGEFAGKFSANDFIFTTGYAHRRGNFGVGANIKLAASDFIDYFAAAVLFDVGGIFRHPSQDLTVGITVKNFGFILSDYTGQSDSYVPFDVRLGAAYKPEHMPIRFNINFYNLTDYNITHYNIDHTLNNEPQPSVFDKVFSHVSLGTELLLSKNFHLLAGYNHLVRRELRLENKSAGAGISYGLEITVKKFDLAYSRAHYTAGKAVNQLGVSLNLKEFNKTKL